MPKANTDFTISLVAGIDLENGGIKNEVQFRKQVAKEFEKLAKAIQVKDGKLQIAPELRLDKRKIAQTIDKEYAALQKQVEAIRQRRGQFGLFDEDVLGVSFEELSRLSRRTKKYRQIRENVLRQIFPDSKELSAKQKQFGDLLLKGTDETLARVEQLAGRKADAVYSKRLLAEVSKDFRKFNNLLRKDALKPSELKRLEDFSDRINRYREAVSGLYQTLKGSGKNTEAARALRETLTTLDSVDKRVKELRRASTRISTEAEERKAEAARKREQERRLAQERREQERLRRAQEAEARRQAKLIQAENLRKAGTAILRGAGYDVSRIAPGDLPIAAEYNRQRISELKSELARLKAEGRDATKSAQRLQKQLANAVARQAELNRAVKKYSDENSEILRKQKEQAAQTKKQADATRQLVSTLKKGSAEYQKMQAEARRLAEIRRADQFGFEGLSGSELRAQRGFVEAQIRQRLQAIPNLRGAARATLESQVDDLGALATRLRDAERAATSFKDRMGEAGRTVRQFFRYALGYGALYQVLGAFRALVGSVVELDKELKSLQAISAATEDQMISVASAVKNVAVTTKFSVGEIARAARTLAQAGVQPEEITTTLQAVAQFAAGTETSIETAADLLSTMRNVYKDLEDQQLADKLTKAVNISKLTGDDLKVILSISAQVSKAMNLSADQYLAAVSVLRNAGLKASTVATGLRQGLLELFSPDTKLIKALQVRYGQIGEVRTEEDIRKRFQGFKAAANPLVAVLRELQRLGFTGAGKKTLTRAFDIRAENAINALIDNVDKLETAASALSVGGAAAQASATQLESLANAWDNLGAAISVVSSDIADSAIPALTDLVHSATDAVNALDELDRKSRGAGGSGLASVLPFSLAGAAVGAAFGKGISGKFLASTAGAVGGGALALGGQYATAETGSNKAQTIADMIGIASLVIGVLGAAFRRLPKGAIRLLTGGGGAKAAAEAAEGVSKVTGAFGAIARFGEKIRSLGFLKKLAPLATVGKYLFRFLPGIGTLVTLATTIYSVFQIFGVGTKNRIAQLQDQLKSLRRLEEQRNSDLAEAQAVLDQFKTSGRRYIAKEGTPAARFENLVNSLQASRADLADALGADAETLSQYLDVLEQLSKGLGAQAGTLDRQRLLAELSSRLGSEVNDSATLSTLINTYVSNIEGIRSQFDAYIKEYYKALEAKNKTKQQRLLIEAFNRLQEDSPEFAKLVAAAQSGVPEAINRAGGPQAMADFVARLFAEIAKTAEADVQEAQNKVKETQQKAVETLVKQLYEAVYSGGDFTVALKNFRERINAIDATTQAGQEALKQLQLSIEDLQRSLSAIDEEFNKRRSELRKQNEAYRKVLGVSDPLYQNKVNELEKERTQALKAASQAAARLQSLVAFVEERQQAGREAIAQRDKEFAAQAAYVRQALSNQQRAASFLQGQQFNANAFVLGENKVEFRKALEEFVKNDEKIFELAGVLSKLSRKQVLELAKLLRAQQQQDELARPEVRRQLLQTAKTQYGQANPEVAKQRQLELLKEQENELRARKEYAELIQEGSVFQRRQNKELEIAKDKIALAERNLAQVLASRIGDSKEAEKKRDAATKKLIDAETAYAQLLRKQAKERLQLSLEAGKYFFNAQKTLIDLQKQELKLKGEQLKALGDTNGLVDLQKKLRELDERSLAVKQALLVLNGEDATLIQKRIEVERKAAEQRRRDLVASQTISALQTTTRDIGPGAYRSLRGIRFKTNAEEIKALSSSIPVYLARLNKLQEAQKKAFQAKDAKNIRLYGDEIKRVSGELADMRDRLREINSNIVEQFQLLGNFDLWISAFDNLNYEAGNLATTISSDLAGAVDAFSSALRKSILEGASFKDTFKAALSNIFADIAESLTKTLVTKVIRKVLEAAKGASGGQGGFFDILFGSGESDTAGTQATQAADAAVSSAEIQQLKMTQELQQNSLATQQNTQALQMLVQALQTAQAAGSSTSAGAAGVLGIGANAGAVGEAVGEVVDKTEEQTGILSRGFGSLFDVSKWSTRQIVGAVGSLGLVLSAFRKGNSVADRNKQLAGGLALAALNYFFPGSSSIGSSLAQASYATGGVNLKPKGYATGSGIIKGPGTGTSDSIPAMLVGRNRIEPIRVSAGESILTAKATKLLGENTIRALNSGRIKRYASGIENIAGAQPATASLLEKQTANAPEVNVQPNIVNVLDPSLVEDFVTSEDGQDVIVNIIQRNRERIS